MVEWVVYRTVTQKTQAQILFRAYYYTVHLKKYLVKLWELKYFVRFREQKYLVRVTELKYWVRFRKTWFGLK